MRFHYLVARHEDWSSGFGKSQREMAEEWAKIGLGRCLSEVLQCDSGRGLLTQNGDRRQVAWWVEDFNFTALPQEKAASRISATKGVLVWHANAIWWCQHSQSSHRSSNVLRHLFCYDTCIADKRLENR